MADNLKIPHAPRNRRLPGGVMKYSRSVMYKKKALYRKKKVVVKKTEVKEERFMTKPIGGEKNGKERVVPIERRKRYYPTEDLPRPLKHRKNPKPAKLRSSITPGTVLILLAGIHRGKRVVFLKQMKSGLLLVTGPFKLNGCPLRRVDQAYVIATKTQVPLDDLKVPARLTDEALKREKKKKSKRAEDMFDSTREETYKPSQERKDDQKAVDQQVLESVKKVPQLKSYLSSIFSLKKGQYPHSMVF
ncbi:large ribosomal subunit protein eL6-like [Corticium candelabrum]|uniref:large ribosomal subunit protein eL6-like n=1 Tax=Corticium candelabrum TaxID=121492 RepID=UPI002E25D1D4|nr:large ribosomal subunit protein eL6-like [Corticium candelabrum]